MFITGNFKNIIPDTIQISFVRNNNTKRIYFEALGEIARVSDEGIGIKFHSMEFNCSLTLVEELVIAAENPVTVLKEIPEMSPFEITVPDV